MATSLTIRRYQEGDHRDVWALLHLAEGTLTSDQAPPIRLDEPRYYDIHHIDEMYIRRHGEFLVGLHEGRLVAMGGIQRTTPDRAAVPRVRVHRDVQRRGFGRAIMQALETRAVELGYTTLHLDTTVTRVAAQKLYQSLGYREVGRLDDNPDCICILYEKRLDVGDPCARRH